MNNLFDKDKVLLLYQLILEKTGGLSGIRDEGLLESSIASIYQTFDGKELYPTKEEKAARLCFSLISNHCFADGNKRIGIVAMLSFLNLNGIYINVDNSVLEKFGWDIAKGKLVYKDILAFIKEHEEF
jgi:death-on-curing protein